MKALFGFVSLVFPLILVCQEFNYINYDTKDGLAGSTVYSMCQDKDGFMWFATENGLSRFDGIYFKNYTVKDGLPDNEVLRVFSDSKGRVWIGCFANQLCFYYDGIIYNEKNCDLIRKVGRTKSNLESVVEDKHGYLGLSFKSSVVIITPSDSILKYTFKEISENRGVQGAVDLFNGAIRIGIDEILLYDFDDTSLRWVKKHEYPQLKEEFIDSTIIAVRYDTIHNLHTKLTIPGTLLSFRMDHITADIISTTDGAWSINRQSLQLDRHFLPGKKISTTIMDLEKNTWFASLGEGVFKLTSMSIQNLSGMKNVRGKEIYTLIDYQNQILAGSEYSQAILVDENLNHKTLIYADKGLFPARSIGSTNRLYTAVKISDSMVVLGYDGFLVKLENGIYHLKNLSPIKSVARIDRDFIIVGTSSFAFKVRLKDLKITDTVWRERCTRVFYKDKCYYIGTLRGLFEVREDKSFTYLGDLYPSLTRRITDITEDSTGLLWVSTSDDGAIALRNKKIVYHINDNNGLSSNICKTILADGHTLWIGTNKGINKIVFRNNKYFITKFTSSDGLTSDIINALYVRNGRIWVGSPAGLSFFNEREISSSSICNLKMLSISVKGKNISSDSTYHFSYRNNDLRFAYAGISFRSGSEMTYWYRLNGLDREWRQTKENSLDYETLPPGDYKLELYAVNKYGVKSNTFVYTFFVTTPFWKTTWFYLLVLTMLFSLVLFLLSKRNRQIRSKLEQTNRFQKQLAELEQHALQSQMNPHFIFNCLNSIQQYILTNEKEKANLYLTKFSSLIRQTLDISAQKTITIAEEISYLKKYLDMELMRFGDSFEYSIKIENIIDPASIEIPALLLQPFVENAIRHGIRFKDDGKGKVLITFSLKQGILYCQIQDNGVGREKALEFKSKQHIEYQSRGMGLTSKRINLLNAVNEKKIFVTVLDLKNKDNVAAGTSIEITMPV